MRLADQAERMARRQARDPFPVVVWLAVGAVVLICVGWFGP